MYRLKKNIRPKENKNGGYEILFWDSKKDEAVFDIYVSKGTIGELVNQGKVIGSKKRHLTFWLDDNRSIEFFGWKHLKEYIEPVGDYYSQILKYGKIIYQ
jgi:hypothetical protein|tara:strand:- start:79 stop:378 length:300 start_codon:yes stop_codon:yes gene_type:complete